MESSKVSLPARNHICCSQQVLLRNVIKIKKELREDYQSRLHSVQNATEGGASVGRTKVQELLLSKAIRNEAIDEFLDKESDRISSSQLVSPGVGRLFHTPGLASIQLLRYIPEEGGGETSGLGVLEEFEFNMPDQAAKGMCAQCGVPCQRCASEPADTGLRRPRVASPLSRSRQSLTFHMAKARSCDELRLEFSMRSWEDSYDENATMGTQSHLAPVPYPLKGPNSIGLDVKHASLSLPKVFPVRDIVSWSPWFLVCSTTGLWFFHTEESSPVKICDEEPHSACVCERGQQVFVTGTWRGALVRKYDIRAGLPFELKKSGFKVKGGKSLFGIACSPSGLLAVGDFGTKKITIHDQSGDLLRELKGPFDGGDPYRLTWHENTHVCARVNIGGSLPRGWVACFQVSTGSCQWKSEMAPGAWTVTSSDNFLFLSVLGSPLLKVIDMGQDGKVLEKSVVCKGDQAVGVYQREGSLIVISYRRKDV